VLKLTTIRRQGTITVLGRNLAVRVLIEKTERAELRDTISDGPDNGLFGYGEKPDACSLVAAPAPADQSPPQPEVV